MDGDFRADITRDSFHQRKNFSRVLLQQGRVQLDADWNEQIDILLHYMRTLACDMLGPHAGPKEGLGFVIAKPASPKAESTEAGKKGKKGGQSTTQPMPDNYTVLVKNGHYYVDGILCELERDIKQYVIEDEEQDAAQLAGEYSNKFLFYLDVWEREVIYLEDDSIREVALGGPDTATRAQVVCQVRVKALASLTKLLAKDKNNLPALLGKNPTQASPEFTDAWTNFVCAHAHIFPAVTSKLPTDEFQVGYAQLKARTIEPEDDTETDPCIVPPSSPFRGLENQLYRVEVHTSGYACEAPTSASRQGRQTHQAKGDSEPPEQGSSPCATFKWSRDNGSIVFPITSAIDPGTYKTLTITVGNLGRDDSRFVLNIDDWVEIVEYEDTLELEPGKLMRVTSVDYANMQVSLAAFDDTEVGFDTDRDLHRPLLLRRWDYQGGDSATNNATTLANDGALEIIENHWLTLENGIQVLFHRDVDPAGKADKDADDLRPFYHTGDYWLIPARTAIGDIEWPRHGKVHEALPPHGIKHHYAPLGYVAFDGGQIVSDPISLQRTLQAMG